MMGWRIMPECIVRHKCKCIALGRVRGPDGVGSGIILALSGALEVVARCTWGDESGKSRMASPGVRYLEGRKREN